MKTFIAPIEILMAVLVVLGTGLEPVRAGINEWTSLGPYGGPIKALAIDPRNTRTMYAATYGRVFKTVDGAASWMPASTGLTGYPIFSGLAIDPQNTSTLYAWGDNFTGLFKSADGAASWNIVTLPDRFTVSAVAIGPGRATYVSGTISGANYGPPQYSAILKSLDGGANWSTLTLPEHFFAQRLAIVPQSPNIIYVAGYAYAGDPDAEYSTVLRTTDAGDSWIAGAKLTSPVVLLVPDPRSAYTIYVGTYGFGVYSKGGGVYKSTDGGASWSAANSGFPDGFVNALALAIDPGDSSTLYAVMGVELWGDYSLALPQGGCCLLPGSVFKSTDAGANWTEVNSGVEGRHQGRRGSASREGIDQLAFDTNSDGDFRPLPVGLAVDLENSGTVYVGTNGNGIFKSTDGGTNWKAANVGLTAMIDTVAVDPQHASTIYAAGWTRLFKSEDGGLTWRSSPWGVPELFVRVIAIDAQSPSTIYAGAPSQEDGSFIGGVFRSMDGGTNWSATGLRCGVENLAIDGQNTLYAATDCGLYKTTDGGGRWDFLDTGRGPTYAIAIDPLNSNTIYTNGWPTCCGSNQVYKSVDGGGSWMVANSGLPDSAVISALLIDPVSPNILYAEASNVDSSRAGLYKSTDGAATWKRIGPGFPLAIDPQNSHVLYAAMPGGLSRSTDGGGNWNSVNTGLQGPVGKLAFDPVNSSTVYAVTDAGIFTITFVP